MPKPTNKKELLAESKKIFDKLFELIDSYPKAELEKEFPKGTLNRNVRDVLAHLHEWHLMFLGWHKVGMKGEKPDMPAKGYTWQTMPDLNLEIWKKYQPTSLTSAKTKLKKSYAKVIQVIEQHSDKELFTKKKYKWTGSTSLGAYLIANSSSHYVWGIKIIKRGLKGN